MLTKEQTLNLLEILATASITGVGFAIGGTIGAAVISSIGINLSSNIIQSGCVKLKERWLSSNDGIPNQDIQKTLARAFIKALIHLETEYFKLGEANALPKNEKESIKALFKELREQAQEVFLDSLERAIKEQEIKNYLYGGSETATDNLWERINGKNLLYTYSEQFRNFFRQNLLNEVQFWFSEELKTDSKECNKAWRAFQRLLLEGILADVKAVQDSQELIHQDLQTLDVLRNQLEQLKDKIDHRLPDEPFLEGIEMAIHEMHVVLGYVAKKVDGIAFDVKKLLDVKTDIEIPKIPDDIQALLDEGWDLWGLGKYEDARIVFQRALTLATHYKHNFSIAKTKCCLAVILNEWDKKPNEAKALLQEGLQEFKTVNSKKDIGDTLYHLGVINIDTGNLDEAESYLSQALEFHKKYEMKQQIAQTFHQLGWVKNHHGLLKEAREFYDQAQKYFLSVYQEGNPKTEKDAIHGVAGCYQHKGMVYKREGKVEEAESNFMRALDWCRKSGFKPDVGKILYLLAELKYNEAQNNAGTQFLDEAIDIYNEIQDYSWYTRCLDLKGRLYFTLGQIDKATAIFESALNVVEKSGNYKGQEEYLNKLGHVYLESQKFEQAKVYFEQARDLSLREELIDGYASSVINLAQIAFIEKNYDERNRLLSDGVQTLEKLMLSIQAEPKRAFLIGKIGFLYESMENFPQALVYYQKAKEAFKSLSDIRGRADCLDSIARIKGSIGRKNADLRMQKEEFETYYELKKLVDGSPYYNLIANTAINLGRIQIQKGELDEAKSYFQEAELLCRKYNLPYLPDVRESIRCLQEQNNLRNPPELNFEQLIEELFELVNWFPEAKDSIFRLWMWGRKETLLRNYQNTAFMVCQDHVDTFLGISKLLHLYSYFCLQIVSSEYPGTGIDNIPFPIDKNIFFDCGIPYKEKIGKDTYKFGFLSGGIHSRYQLTLGTTVRSKLTGNVGMTITGRSLGLPEQAHQLVLSSSAAELISQKIFFLPYERHLANDKLLSDLKFSKKLGLIPIYFDSLPNSESVEVFTSATIDLPILLPEDAEHQRKQIRKVKQSLSQLSFVTKDSAQSSLNNFIFELNELSDSCVGKQSIQIYVYILGFSNALKRELHVALVMIDYQI